jgi:hypothetical protein
MNINFSSSFQVCACGAGKPGIVNGVFAGHAATCVLSPSNYFPPPVESTTEEILRKRIVQLEAHVRRLGGVP